jgi:hypothetical protein
MILCPIWSFSDDVNQVIENDDAVDRFRSYDACSMNNVRAVAAVALGWVLLFVGEAAAVPASADPEFKVTDLEPVWAGHSVRFALLSHGGKQFTAYFDADRMLSVAERALDSAEWKITKLDSKLGWDSHNYLTLAVDRDGYLHLSGNMHCVPLVYFRSELPLDASSMKPVHRMTGEREGKTTYPVFYRGPQGELIFAYRDGSSGDGDTLFNVYDVESRTWSRLHDGPLLDGRGEMNAYPVGPELGPDGYYHLTWVWRAAIMAETNRDLSYMRSRDFKHWETADGKPVRLPVTSDNKDVLVDPVPVNGGILNGSGKVGFDLNGVPVIAYHKFDKKGNTQLYFARHSAGSWQITQASQWDYRWEIQGGGSIGKEIGHGALVAEGGALAIGIEHVKEGRGRWAVDPGTLRLKEKLAQPEPRFLLPPKLRRPLSDFPEMKIQMAEDSGATDDGYLYRLRWESLGPNRDQPRPKPWPEATMLRVVGWKKQAPEPAPTAKPIL